MDMSRGPTANNGEFYAPFPWYVAWLTRREHASLHTCVTVSELIAAAGHRALAYEW